MRQSHKDLVHLFLDNKLLNDMMDPFVPFSNSASSNSFSENVSCSQSTSPTQTSTALMSISDYSLPNTSARLFMQSSNDGVSTTSSDSTFTSFLIGNILEAMSLQDDQKQKPLCFHGDGSTVTAYCHDCHEHFCEQCVSVHNQACRTKALTTKAPERGIPKPETPNPGGLPYLLPPPSTDRESSCSIHANEVCTLYCEACSVAICKKCTVYEHVGHNVQHLQQVMDSCKTVSLQLLTEAKTNYQELERKVAEIQQMASRVVGRSKLVASEIHSNFLKHILALQQREQDLMSMVEQVKQTKCQILSSQLGTMQQSANGLQLAMDEVRDTLNSGTDLSILKARDKIKQCVLLSSQLRESFRLHEDDFLLFAQPDRNILTALTTLGNVKTSVCAPLSFLCRDESQSSPVLCGSQASFTIHARDHLGSRNIRGHEAFEVTVERPDGTSFRVNTLDAGEGRHTFRIHLAVEGRHVVSARYNGQSIRDSPLVVHAKTGMNYVARAASGAALLTFGKEGDKPGELCRPWGICCDSQGHFVVADRSNNRMQIFNADGSFHHKFGSPGSKAGQFDRPAGVTVDQAGNIIVADKDNHRIQIFRFDGTFVRAFGERGSKNGQFTYPWDVAVNSVGVIAVTDTRNHRIQLFSFDGTFLSKYGFEGAMWKHFDSPRGVAFTKDGRLVVTDFNNHRLVIIQPDLQSARYLGSEGSQTLQFLRPQGVAIDDEGNIVVADSRNHRLQVFTPSGALLAVFGANLQPGNAAQMDRPSGVAVTGDGRIAVVDFGNNRVIVF